MDLSTLKPKEMQKEYAAFIGEPKKVDYYTKKFQKMKHKNTKISFNIWGLLFSSYWCFYRKMLGWGCIALIINLGSMYLNFAYGLSSVTTISSILLSIFFGFFGNYCYMNYVDRSIAHALDLDDTKKVKYYKDNGGDGTKILLCMLFVSVVMVFALAASYGLPDAMTQSLPQTTE